MHPLIEAVKRIRKSKHMSQSTLGKLVGLPQSHISKIEKGQTDLRLSSLTEISQHLDHTLMMIPNNKRIEVLAVLGLDEHERPEKTIISYTPPPMVPRDHGGGDHRSE